MYLAPSSPANIVIEVNQRVSPQTAADTADVGDSNQNSSEKIDKDALLYHLKDLVESTPERSLPSSTTETNQTSIHLPPTPVSLAKFHDPTPAYLLSAASTDTFTDISRPQWSTKKETMIFLLLVRLKQQETDLLVVLSADLTGVEDQRARLQEREQWAKEVFEKIAASLKIKDWGLFA